MKITCISDTHSLHNTLSLPGGDVLVHAGDLSRWHQPQDIDACLTWMSQQDYRHKIAIPGNHDIDLLPSKLLKYYQEKFTGIHILVDRQIVLDGVNFYGSSWVPRHKDWAWKKWSFALDHKEDLDEVWAKIPDDVQVLITHSPANLLDEDEYNTKRGCTQLEERLKYLKNLRCHLFGHIHDGYGISQGVYTSVNAAMLDKNWKMKPPINFTLSH